METKWWPLVWQQFVCGETYRKKQIDHKDNEDSNNNTDTGCEAEISSSFVLVLTLISVFPCKTALPEMN